MVERSSILLSVVTFISAGHVAGMCENNTETKEEGTFGEVASYVILAIYAIEWFVLLFPNVIPLARPASSLLGSILILIVTQIGTYFGLESFNAFCYIDYQTLALLFGLMLIVVMIDDSGILLLIEMSLEHPTRWWSLTKITLVSGFLSAIVMNDTVCLFFTGPVIEACRKNPRIEDPLPYLVALASSSNIGSTLTLTGNPQNAMIGYIAKDAGVTYLTFAKAMALPGLMAFFINWICLLVWYRHSLGIFGCGDPVDDIDGAPMMTEEEEQARKDTLEETTAYKWFLTLGMLIMVGGFFLGVNIAGLSVAIGGIFMCVRTIRYSRTKAKRRNWAVSDKVSEKYLMQIDWPLLVMFAGLFIMISAVVQTGFPEMMFNEVFANCVDDPVGKCPIEFGIAIAVFANIISNVPLILLIKPFLEHKEDDAIIMKNWLYVAWICTVAGNFILLGSAANLIVADQARKMGFDILSTYNHGKFGIPVTIICCAAGIPILLMVL